MHYIFYAEVFYCHSFCLRVVRFLETKFNICCCYLSSFLEECNRPWKYELPERKKKTTSLFILSYLLPAHSSPSTTISSRVLVIVSQTFVEIWTSFYIHSLQIYFLIGELCWKLHSLLKLAKALCLEIGYLFWPGHKNLRVQISILLGIWIREKEKLVTSKEILVSFSIKINK